MFHELPSFPFFRTNALATALPGVVLMRLEVQRGRASAPVNAVCAPGRFASM
jgi:hypothetical protein